MKEQEIDDMLYEMNKPLARYQDDEDLDKLLRERERAEDPMLDYIRKQKERHKSDKKPGM
jgi:pre-mRNA-splicing factor CWC26